MQIGSISTGGANAMRYDAARAGIPATEGQMFAALTPDDVSLIKATTGEDLSAPGSSSGLHSMFAFQIAMDRVGGRLPASQQVSAQYLEQVAREYKPGSQTPIPTRYLDKALAYLTDTKPQNTGPSA